MDNLLQNYFNKELKDAIQSVQVVQGTAKDSGNIYYAIEITFINNYKKRLFLRSDEQFAWCNAFDMIESNQVIQNNF